MPPKGYKKGFVKNEAGEWVDPRTTQKKAAPKKAPPKPADDLTPPTKKTPVQAEKEYAKVLVVWKDTRIRKGSKMRTTEYIMHDLHIDEGVSREFNGAVPTERIVLTLTGSVREKK